MQEGNYDSILAKLVQKESFVNAALTRGLESFKCLLRLKLTKLHLEFVDKRQR
jgi:hypothetical protein